MQNFSVLGSSSEAKNLMMAFAEAYLSVEQKQLNLAFKWSARSGLSDQISSIKFEGILWMKTKVRLITSDCVII